MYTIYHNPRCSKSRATLKLLEEAGVNFVERLYLENPPTEDELHEILTLLGVTPYSVVRAGEAAWKASGFDRDSRDTDIIRFIVTNPTVLERPIVLKDHAVAVIGRPPENVKTIL